MAHDVFISHSASDKAAADAVCASLEGKGLRCWIAPRDILAGKDWDEAIVEGIEGSSVMVLILSSHSNGSQQVIREVKVAANKNLAIVPFRIEDVRPTKRLDYFLMSTHWLDAFSAPLGPQLEKLSESIRALLKGAPGSAPGDHTLTATPSEEAPPAPTAEASKPAPTSGRENRQWIKGTAAVLGLALVGLITFQQLDSERGQYYTASTATPRPTPPRIPETVPAAKRVVAQEAPDEAKKADGGESEQRQDSAASAATPPSPRSIRTKAPAVEIPPASEEAVITKTSENGIKTMRARYKLAIGDLLEISVDRQDDLRRSLRVSQNGTVSFPLVGAVAVGGLSKTEAQDLLAEKLRSFIASPKVTVIVKVSGMNTISIQGEVSKPGTYDIPAESRMTVMQAISMAGGFTSTAASDRTRVIRIVNGKSQSFKIDVSHIIHNDKKDLILEPGDVIYVPESFF